MYCYRHSFYLLFPSFSGYSRVSLPPSAPILRGETTERQQVQVPPASVHLCDGEVRPGRLTLSST
jgi:hypothetical protein